MIAGYQNIPKQTQKNAEASEVEKNPQKERNEKWFKRL